MDRFDRSRDHLRIRNWVVDVGIGVWESELAGTQKVHLDVRLWGNFRSAAISDRLEDSIDYSVLKSELETFLLTRRWGLIEALGESICDFLLRHPFVEAVSLELEKPAALAPAVVGYTVFRSKMTQ